MNTAEKWHGTTIVLLRKNGETVVIMGYIEHPTKMENVNNVFSPDHGKFMPKRYQVDFFLRTVPYDKNKKAYPQMFGNYFKDWKEIFEAKIKMGRTKDLNDLKILLEPGRVIMADAGAILTKVEYVKKTQDKNFAIIDAAMNDLMRPSLYGAFHKIVNTSETTDKESVFDIVGPICETGDFIGKDRVISIEPNNILVIMDTGAYAMSMSSNYNTRPRLYELMIDKAKTHIIREKETFDHLIKGEKVLPES